MQKETVFNGNGFTVKYVIDSIWENQYTANVTITNTGSSTIENWELSYQSADEYSNIWNAEVTCHSARNYNVKNLGYNQNIAPGQSVSFGFQASFTGTPDIPKSYQMLGESQPVDGSDCQVTCKIQNQWNSGCIMEVTIYNSSDENIEDWSLQFDLPDRIDNIWRAEIASASEHTYRLKNCGYNAVIQPGTGETFGMQLSFPDGSAMHEPQNISVTQYKKGKWYVDFDKEWNRIMTHADSATVKEAAGKNRYAVNVAVIDSGVDYSANMNIVKRETFVDGYDDSNPLFDDLSGHGTAVAGLLCSNSAVKEDSYQFEDKYLQKIMNEKIDGISPYINVYSAKVLDSDNKTTVNRLVAAIDWAVENNANIINISCGVNSGSAKLHSAVKKAYDRGILLVAAAGNGGNIQYPAKYEEVMAVGAVTCSGTGAKSCSTGKELEVVAPGQDVTSYGPFGMLTSFSGSSMAAPQVAALAAVLWQQDLSKNSDFIRKLIDVTARSLGSREKYGYGLIDCEYALQNYHEFEQQYHAPEAAVEEYEIDSNMDALLCLDEETVEGYWKKNQHEITSKKMEKIREGTLWPDKKKPKVNGHDNPAFHGYSDYNYVKAYRFISKAATKMYKDGEWIAEKDCADKDEKKLLKQLVDTTEKYGGFHEYKCTRKEEKGLFLYGMSLHTVADIFAHSTAGIKGMKDQRKNLEKKSLNTLCSSWKRLTHGPKDPKTGKPYPETDFADNPGCIKNRWTSAKRVCDKIIATSINKHKAGTKDVFTEIKYYKKCSTVKKYKEDAQKKKYVINSYGIIKLSEYLKPGDNKKLKEVVNNASNAKVKKVVEQWK